VHRVGQFLAHVRARVDPDEEAMVQRLLPTAAAALFAGMPVADRRHGLDVAERLVATGVDDPDVLSAALLHDAGKGRRVRLWHRVAGVLVEAVSPRVLERLASPNPQSWRFPFHLYLHHATISAGLATAAGCTPRVGAFIIGEVSSDDAHLARALKAADDAS
jgi:hypothetical protein